MTEPNMRENIAEELGRADRSLEAADVLYDHKFFNEAVSRLYYHVLYLVRALLLTKSLEPRSHEGALRWFALHFVKTEAFPAESAHTISKLMKFRGEADYNPSYVFTAEDYQSLRQETRSLAEKIRAFLRKEGYLPS